MQMTRETRLASSNGAEPEPGPPVFVLCNGRSGSTLLRFLLDSHPDLACPPETNLPAIAAQLATVWSLIEGAPLAAERGDEPPAIPDAAIAGVRRTMDQMTGSYLARRGKKRYCDKSLGTARFAELLLRVYPEAKFLCLYRHPMDVIASGIEACPWGLSGYGFDPYIASTPGNVVCALARFWVDAAEGALAAEEQLATSCHRVRYEDLVADPEAVAAGIFEFLGVAPAPGISRRCFSMDRERFGPADYKIWHTSKITASSVGRGWSVPVGMIPPPVAEQMTQLTGRLGYVPVDGKWGTAAAPSDLRVTGQETRTGATAGTPVSGSAAIARRLRAGLAQAGDELTEHWGACAKDTFMIVATPSAATGGGVESNWRVDLAAGTVTAAIPADSEDDDSAWDVVGSAEAWQGVLDGQTNLGVALRRCDLRYCDEGDGNPVLAGIRLDMLAGLLGVASRWEPATAAALTATAAG
jgi:sulfotransferase family protein